MPPRKAAKPVKPPKPAKADPPEIRQVLDSIRRVVRILRVASRDAEKRLGLSAAQLFVLHKLADGPPAQSVNEVAAATHTHQSSVSVVVQRLVERRLVSRKRSPSDARQTLLSVTAAGRAQLRAAPAAAQDQLIGALRQLPVTTRGQLAGSLHALLDLLGVDRDEPAVMLFEQEAETTATGRVRANARRSRTRA